MPRKPKVDPSPFVWVYQDFDTGATLVFTAEHLAMDAAERTVGNRAVADMGDVLMYGPGDGTSRIMIERVRRETALSLGYDIPIG